MPDYLLSKFEYILPAAYMQTKYLKHLGYEKSFFSLVELLKELQEGIAIDTGGKTRTVHFVLGLIVGDNLGLNSVLGYVQSFNALKYCRACTRTRSEMQFDTEQSTEALRNKENYKSDLQLNNFKETGVKNSCIFERLPGFSVTDNITFDIMHDIFEGVCQYDLCNVLQSLINDNVISLSTINSRKSLLQFGEIEIGNISGDLEPHRLNFNLSMSASESMCFVNFFNFIIGDLIPVSNKHWLVFTSMLKISDVILKTKFLRRRFK